MPRTVLIGLDGSPYSEAAIEMCVEWAKKQSSCLLVGLGVIDEPTIRSPSAIPIGGGAFKGKSDDARMADARRQVEQFLEKFTLTCTEAQVSHKLLEDEGSPVDSIIRQSERYDLIVLGQRTYFHFETESRPGETLTAVLRNTPRPIVAVPSPRRTGSSTIVAYDGSLQAAKALQAFQQSGLASHLPVHIVSIGDDKVEAARTANVATEFLASHDIKSTPHPIASNDAPSSVLADQIQALDANMLVMGAYGASFLKEFVMGSCTSRMIHDSTVPLFLYH